MDSWKIFLKEDDKMEKGWCYVIYVWYQLQYETLSYVFYEKFTKISSVHTIILD